MKLNYCRTTEEFIKVSLVDNLKSRGYFVATEVPNFSRSADVAVIDNKYRIWVIECKMSNIEKAIRQLRTHKQSADRVFIAMPCKKIRRTTLQRIKSEKIGLIFVMNNGAIKIEISFLNIPWKLAKSDLYDKILEVK